MDIAFWIASGKEYVLEAACSARSLKKNMPDVFTILFSTGKLSRHGVFDKAVKLPRRRHEWWYLDSVEYIKWCVCEYLNGKAIYFDTDTYICEPLHDVYELLDKYDIVAAHAPGRVTCGRTNGIPKAFPEVNIGVVGVNINERSRSLAKEWLSLYKNNPENYGNNDQGALRHALWVNQDIKLYIFPPEYNLRWQFGGFARYPVHVLHGRAENYEAVRKKVNWTNDLRGWGRGGLELLF